MVTHHQMKGETMESAYRDARIITLQAQLLDHTGHVWHGMSRDAVRFTLDEINRMRELNGWKPLDMRGRYRRH
jgi:hypothetical protein